VFHDISANMREVMRALEEQLERDQRSLRSVDTDVGRVLSLLAMSAPRGEFLELGSSGGVLQLMAIVGCSRKRRHAHHGRSR